MKKKEKNFFFFVSFFPTHTQVRKENTYQD